MDVMTLALCLAFAEPGPPPVSRDDIVTFPSREEARLMRNSYMALREQLWDAWQQERDDPEFYEEWLADATLKYHIWDHLRAAYVITTTTGDMRRLRDLMGVDAYNRRAMPGLPCYAPRLYRPWVR